MDSGSIEEGRIKSSKDVTAHCSWESNNSAIASCEYGFVTIKSLSGACTIIARYVDEGGKTYICRTTIGIENVFVPDSQEMRCAVATLLAKDSWGALSSNIGTSVSSYLNA